MRKLDACCMCRVPRCLRNERCCSLKQFYSTACRYNGTSAIDSMRHIHPDSRTTVAIFDLPLTFDELLSTESESAFYGKGCWTGNERVVIFGIRKKSSCTLPGLIFPVTCRQSVIYQSFMIFLVIKRFLSSKGTT